MDASVNEAESKKTHCKVMHVAQSSAGGSLYASQFCLGDTFTNNRNLSTKICWRPLPHNMGEEYAVEPPYRTSSFGAIKLLYRNWHK